MTDESYVASTVNANPWSLIGDPWLLSVMATLKEQQSRGHHHTTPVYVPQYLTAATHVAFIFVWLYNAVLEGEQFFFQKIDTTTVITMLLYLTVLI